MSAMMGARRHHRAINSSALDIKDVQSPFEGLHLKGTSSKNGRRPLLNDSPTQDPSTLNAGDDSKGRKKGPLSTVEQALERNTISSMGEFDEEHMKFQPRPQYQDQTSFLSKDSHPTSFDKTSSPHGKSPHTMSNSYYGGHGLFSMKRKSMLQGRNSDLHKVYTQGDDNINIRGVKTSQINRRQ